MVPTARRQIFQTEAPGRWKKFIWILRVIAVLMAMAVFVLTYSILHKTSYQLPNLIGTKVVYKRLSSQVIKNSLNQDEKDKLTEDLKYIRSKKRRNFYQVKMTVPPITKNIFPVRAGFYVNWDRQSYYSLVNHISKMNLVIPEWLFLSDSSDIISVKIDSAALNIMRKSKIAVVPLISNFYKGAWNSKRTHQLFVSPFKRKLFIDKLLIILEHYHFQGINIDFEDLSETTDEYVINFQRELYKALHAKGFWVTQDVVPFNPDYNLKALNAYNDLFFLMGYDQHSSMGMPGPIAAQSWVEKALDEILAKVPSEKVVLCIPTYGYDWAVGYQGEDVSYQDAITAAIGYGSKIVFDNNTYNLSFSYTDDGGLVHKVFFTDAVTNFNLMRTAEDYSTAGVALWRLGAEDTRLWKFYDKPLQLGWIIRNPINYRKFERLNSAYNVDFVGDGEILDIIESPHPGRASLEVNINDQLISEEKYDILPTCYVIKRTGMAHKKIALTFDDGPDENYTPKILNILKFYHVPATFFITGVNAESNIPLVKKIYDYGFEIGNHTFTHPNFEETSKDRTTFELRATNLLLESILGRRTFLFRPPYSTDTEPMNIYQLRPLEIAKNEDLYCIGALIDPNDWQKGVTADTIISRVKNQEKLGNIILLHDAGGNRTQTVKALPAIIRFFKNKGYSFVLVSDLMGKTRNEVMPSIAGGIDKYALYADKTIFEITYFYEHILAGIFFLALLLTFVRTISLGFLAWYNQRKIKKAALIQASAVSPMAESSMKKVSIIVPAYNEAVTAVKTVKNLLKCNYPDFEVIFVDDGSKDDTLETVKRTFEGVSNVTVLTKPNGGKASALNLGLEHALGEILICIDADTLLNPDAASILVKAFDQDDIAAVAGNVKVGNQVNLLTRWQSIEYTTSQNFDRLAFDYVNAIMVVPGAIGAFRKDYILSVGGFMNDTLAEDCDITIRLLRAGYKVRTCNEALSMTEAPENVRMFIKQRFRWTFGIMQCFWKHKDLLFSGKKSNMGWILMPNVLIFQLILPLFSPIIDFMMLISLFTSSALKIAVFYFAYMIVDCIISGYAFHLDKQRFTLKTIARLFVQRIVYRQFLCYVLIKAYLRAVKGELTSWGVLKRTGNVQ